jgi:hypothetical protein
VRFSFRPFAVPVLFGLFLGTPFPVSAQSSNNASASPGAQPEGTVVLSPLYVGTKPFGCFGMSTKARRDGLSPRVSELTVLSVSPNSDADKEGIGPLTQILRIDGRSVGDFIASYTKGTDLGAKLINRKKGDQITLEVLILGARTPKRVTLVEGHGVHEFPFESDSEVEPMRTTHVGISR